MPNEDEYFITGMGRFYQGARRLWLRGAELGAIARAAIGGLRTDILHP